VSGNTGLLTRRCDPYGAETQIRLLGGVFPESHNGPQHWYCANQAAGRYRMTCRGGAYGTETVCDGGHRGVPMPLCPDHVIEIQRRQSDSCPACLFPPPARALSAAMDQLQYEIAATHPLMMGRRAALLSQLDTLRFRMGELQMTGRIHRCPLELTEVS
jgi:hypothetical protein